MLRFVFVVLFILFYSSYGYGDTCIPDCPNSPWSQPDYIDIYSPTCDEYFRVTYRYRNACSTWNDYYIERIELNGSSCLDDYFNGDLNLIMQEIIEQLIISNPANFPPTSTNDCNYNWRVLKGSCWAAEIITDVPKAKEAKDMTSNNPGPDYDLLVPCTTNDCCLEFYKVCTDAYGNRYIEQTGYLPPEDPDCGIYDYCQPVCGSVYNR